MSIKHLVRPISALAVAALLLAGSLSIAHAQRDTNYTLDWWTVDGGGQTQPGGTGYTLSGTIGQPDAGGWSGGGYALSGGFWGGGPAAEYTVYLPVILRNH